MKWLLALALAACTSNVRIEAERAIAVGERVRKLSIEDQRAALEALQALGCEDADVCHVRDACLRVVKPTLLALEHKREAIRAMEAANAAVAADAGPEQLEAHKSRAASLLDAAHEELEQGKAAVPECDGALAVLERSAKGK